MKKLNPKIVAELAKKLNKEPSTIKKDVYLLAKDYATCTKNAVAQPPRQDGFGGAINLQIEKETPRHFG